MLRRAFLCLAIVITGPLLRAQDARFRVEHLTSRDGLSHSSVRCIIRDHYGFMWFGTRAGLDRYDGYGVFTYRHDPFDTASLSDYGVTALTEDSSGAI